MAGFGDFRGIVLILLLTAITASVATVALVSSNVGDDRSRTDARRTHRQSQNSKTLKWVSEFLNCGANGCSSRPLGFGRAAEALVLGHSRPPRFTVQFQTIHAAQLEPGLGGVVRAMGGTL